jgi:DNA-binding protein
MNNQKKVKFQKRLTNIEYQLQSLQNTKEILVKGDEPANSKALAFNEIFRQGYLDELKILEIDIKLALDEKKRFWIF